MNPRKSRLRYLSIRASKNFLKTNRRSKRFQKAKAGFYRHLDMMSAYAKLMGRTYVRTVYTPYRSNLLKKIRPEFSKNIKFLASVENLFSKRKYSARVTSQFDIPEHFSLIDQHYYKESFDFLKKLFITLYDRKTHTVNLDYSKCKRIDVDASICMDIILMEFNEYLKKCRDRGITEFPAFVYPRNFQSPDIMRILFSIGAYKNLKKLSITYSDVKALPLLTGYQNTATSWQQCELHTTQIVDYIQECLSELHRELSVEAVSSMYKVLGEIMTNAEEHSTMPYRYAVGFFQKIEDSLGIFNFTVFNFGNTIYQTFKDINCANKAVIQQMSELSESYTKRGLLRKAEFEEETLWTLYALQDGVTSKEKPRGSGTIQYIENFFKLKGDLESDNVSQMVVLSGNTRIVFDGTYKIITKHHATDNRSYKMITFNESNDISDPPDKKFVNFAPHYFPGTMITARILIKDDNIYTGQTEK